MDLSSGSRMQTGRRRILFVAALLAIAALLGIQWYTTIDAVPIYDWETQQNALDMILDYLDYHAERAEVEELGEFQAIYFGDQEFRSTAMEDGNEVISPEQSLEDAWHAVARCSPDECLEEDGQLRVEVEYELGSVFYEGTILDLSNEWAQKSQSSTDSAV